MHDTSESPRERRSGSQLGSCSWFVVEPLWYGPAVKRLVFLLSDSRPAGSAPTPVARTPRIVTRG